MNYIVVKYSPSGEYAQFYNCRGRWSYEYPDAFLFTTRKEAFIVANAYSGAIVEEARAVQS